MGERTARRAGDAASVPAGGAPVGISIHLAVNDCVAGRARGCAPLQGCDNDARAMHDLAAAAGFEPRIIAGARATAEAVLGAMRDAGPRVSGDGLLLLTISGHGSRVRDQSTRSGWRYGWELYDRGLMSDELAQVWRHYPAGARVLVLSDSCLSGDLIRGMRGPSRPSTGVWPGNGDAETAAGVWLLGLSAAADHEEAADDSPHGAFTHALLDTWARGSFAGDYVEMHARLYRRLAPRQHPVLSAWPSPGFAHQRPFTI